MLLLKAVVWLGAIFLDRYFTMERVQSRIQAEFGSANCVEVKLAQLSSDQIQRFVLSAAIAVPRDFVVF